VVNALKLRVDFPPHIELVFVFTGGAKAKAFIETPRWIDLYDAECDCLAISSRFIDDDLYYAGADTLPLEGPVQIDLLKQYRVLDRRSLQPSGVLGGDRDDTNLIDMPSPSKFFGKFLDLLSFIPAKQLLGNPSHGFVLDAPAESQIHRLRRPQCDRPHLNC